MKKIDLVAVNAKFIHSNPAVYSLSRYAGGEACGIQIREYTINNRYEDVLYGILSDKPDVIAFSVYIWNADQIIELMRDIKIIYEQEDRDLMLIAGGPEASFDSKRFLEYCDCVILGEGEKTFKKIVDAIQESEGPVAQYCLDKIKDISGIATQDFLHPFIGNDAADMDAIPFLYDELSPFENRIIYYESSRGCPFRCTYCLSSIDRRVRYRNLDTVLAELKYFLDHKVLQVKFVDRTFNSSSKRAIRIWQFIKDYDNGITNFHFEIGADLLGEEEIELLSSLRPGLVQLEIGIQSTNPQTLEIIQRVTDNEKLFKNVAALRKAWNINLHTDLIAGLPFEDLKSFAKSFNDIYPLMADQLQLGFLKVIKGTLMEARAKEYGLVYSSKQPYEILFTKWLSIEDNILLHEICDVVDAFYNSNCFRHSLDYLLKGFESPFAMYQALAQKLEEMGLEKVGLSNAKRIEILSALGKECNINPKLLDSYLELDRLLHMHKSRKMQASYKLEFEDGLYQCDFDYSYINPVTGQARYSLKKIESL